MGLLDNVLGQLGGSGGPLLIETQMSADQVDQYVRALEYSRGWTGSNTVDRVEIGEGADRHYGIRIDDIKKITGNDIERAKAVTVNRKAVEAVKGLNGSADAPLRTGPQEELLPPMQTGAAAVPDSAKGSAFKK